MQRGLVQIYTGDGKGKTTAAVGLAVRALGQGLRVLFVRFLKPEEPASGEVAFLQGCPEIEIVTAGRGILSGESDRETVAKNVASTFALARQKLFSGDFDLAVFDEINNALRHGYLPLEEVLSLLDQKPPEVEIVFTGRGAPRDLIARADLVTMMDAVKHPLKEGVPARRGIEY